ncbi:MAG: hypothetical protein GY769_11055 [bacterium]|nr:hypothetical protein [bacterium]
MSIRQGVLYLGTAAALFLAPGASALEISTKPLECLPSESTIGYSAQVAPEIDGSEQARLYFRRLNRTGAFYWVEMNAKGDGNYWVVFPKPEEREQQELTDEWWEILQTRDWMKGNDREWLEDWLEAQKHEAAEFYVAVADVTGTEISRSETKLVQVLDYEDCRFALDPFELGQSQNLTVGETTELQQGREVFHWLCDGIVSRTNSIGVLRADETCRACVVAGWLPMASAAGALVAGTTIDRREPRRASDIQP